MARAVQFYRSLGFTVRYGSGGESSTSLFAGGKRDTLRPFYLPNFGLEVRNQSGRAKLSS